MTWTSELASYYLGGFEVLFGLFLMWQAGMYSLRPMFARELKDAEFGERFRDVISRREEIEALPELPWRAAGALTILIGILVLARMLDPLLSYAIICLAMGVVAAYACLHLRNRTPRRAASLTPRSTNTSIPKWIYGLSIIFALAPLAFITNPDLRDVAAIISLVVTAMVFLSVFVAENMAAILSGNDAEIELIVEERARRTRIYGLLALGLGSSFVFVCFAMSLGHAKPYQAITQLVLGLAWGAIWIWNTRLLLRKGKPTGGNVHVA